jgi:hypothetical protein
VKVYDGRVGKLLSDVVVKVEYRRRKGKMLEYDMRQLKLTKSRFFPTAPSTLQVLLAGEDGRGSAKISPGMLYIQSLAKSVSSYFA